MKYKLEGTIKAVFETKEFSSGFTKREFVVDTGGDYPQAIKFEVTKERCEKLDALRVGDDVEVDFDVRGNEYNGKYYVNLQAWRVSKQGAEAK